MSWRRRKPEPSIDELAPMTGWSILTTSTTGLRYDLNGYVSSAGRSDEEQAEALRFVNAVADGLRSHGYDVEVRIERTATQVIR